MLPDRPVAVRWRESPNSDDRRGQRVSMLVLHYTGMHSADAALDRLCDADAKVSAHYCIGEDGTAWQLVDEAARAWHAGVSHWRGIQDVNAVSIGIELVNPGHEFGYRPFPRVQMETLGALCQDIVHRHPIPARNIVGHSDVAPTRKMDPGELFDWRWLAQLGIGIVPPEGLTGDAAAVASGATGPAVQTLQQQLQHWGYDCAPSGVFDTATRDVVIAFQRHFAPHRLDGVADGATRAALDWLTANRS